MFPKCFALFVVPKRRHTVITRCQNFDTIVSARAAAPCSEVIRHKPRADPYASATTGALK
eukprot:5055254-Amphidinium_carterae.1